ncbi:MAG TPA: PAS domain S-box protein [Thermoanaerobaculia bacterium]|nr:PAS domain S-box protein [Thermoanaerobaculia bacterium]
MRIPLVDQVMSLVRKPAASRPAASREERVRGAFMKAPVGIAFATADGHWLFVNDRFRALIGYTREELARVTLHGITHPDDAKQELALMKRLVAREVDRYRIEKRVMSKSGRYRAVEVTTALADDMLIYVVDEPQPSILDHLAGVAVIRTDSRGTITGWSAGAEAMFGYSRAEIIGKNRRVLYRDADGWAHKPTSALHRAFDERMELDDWRVRKDGTHVWVHCAISPFESGGARGYVETVTAPPEVDTTPLRNEVEKRKRTEEVLRDAFSDLRRTSEETMNELRIMTAALRDEIDRRKAAEEALRTVNAKLAAVPPPEPEVEEVPVEKPPQRTWRPFGEVTPADALRECALLERTGTLLVSRGDAEKEVFFEHGRLFSCASNDPAKFLAERLVASGTISEEQRQKALEIKRASQLAMGRILLILGAIDEAQLVDAMRQKLAAEVDDFLTWTDGQYVFVEGELPSLQLVPLRIDVEALLSPAALFIASTKSGKVHRPTCMSAKRISGAARVEVRTTDGFELCRQCFR